MENKNIQNDLIDKKLKIKIIGVGGAGNNIIDKFEIQESNLENVKVFLANTDLTHLQSKTNKNVEKISFGKNLTKGNGTGSNPELGREAFREDKAVFEKIFDDADIVFTVFGLGKGTGSGAGPEIARLAKEKNALSIVIAILPFKEMGGKKQNDIANDELETIGEKCDSYSLYSNDNILKQESSDSSVLDVEICRSIQTVIDIIFLPAIINLDFADIKSRLSNSGLTIIGMGSGAGDDKENEAVRGAVESQFIEGSIQGAKSILFHLVCQKKNNFKTLENVTKAIKTSTLNSEDIDFVFGLTVDDSLTDEIFLRIVVNDFPQESHYQNKKTRNKKSVLKVKDKKVSKKNYHQSDLLENDDHNSDLYANTKTEEIKEIADIDDGYNEDMF